MFRLFGYAGVGKTTLARHVAEHASGKAAFAAFTGKAALVLRSKGCAGASTIHSLIYTASEDADGAPQFETQQGRPGLARGADRHRRMLDGRRGAGPRPLSFGKPILVLGDPAQLPPVKGAGFFTESEPDVMLTEIHRQARDNPIIRLSQTIREGGEVAYGDYGETRVIRRDAIDAEHGDGAPIRCWSASTRRGAPTMPRIRQLLGRDGPDAAGRRQARLPAQRPREGAAQRRAVARRRGARHGATTSSSSRCARRRSPAASRSRSPCIARSSRAREADLPYPIRRESDEFDFGYALTVHKAQGSQWDKVVLFDESRAFREHRARWLYTGVTRAARRLILVR